jgi:ribosomal protein S10
MNIELLPKEKLNNFEIRILARLINIIDNSQSYISGNNNTTKPVDNTL